MELTQAQDNAMRLVIDMYWEGCKYACVAGYAGVGKSTLIQHIIANLGLGYDEVAYVTYTGKAAEVLRRKGCPNACTAHRLLYYNNKLADGTFIHKPKPHLDKAYKVIVVDEVSMLPKDMWNLLLSHKIFVIACGDPFQLPSLIKEQDNHVLDKPHVFLKEIMRQAEGNEIIKLSLGIREGKYIPEHDGNTVKVIRQKDVIPGMYLWADQIICSTNSRRREINEYVRALKGFDGDPHEGEKLISLSNHWNITAFGDDSALTNGTIGFIHNPYFDNAHYPVKFRWFPKKIPLIRGEFITDVGENFGYLPIDKTFLETGEKFLQPNAENLLMKMKALSNDIPLDFDYGYAISVWKSQGSSWGKVMVFEEGHPYNELEHQRALYTAITRAEDKLVLVLKD